MTLPRLQLQLERLQSTLNRAYRSVPFHQNRFIANNIDPGSIDCIEALADLPLMTRQDLGAHYPYGLFAVPLRDIVRIHTAPGTAFNPTVSGYTRQDLQLWQEVVATALAAAGVAPQDIMQIHLDAGLSNWGRDYKEGAEAIGAGVIPNTPLSVKKQIMVLRDYKTSVLVTTPDAAAQLAVSMFKSDLNPAELNLKTLILIGEPADPATQGQLEKMLHVTTWRHYGLSEVPGPAIAFECEQHDGLHVNDAHFLIEVIDPQTTAPVPENTPGELVLTTLTTRAFPLLRLRTGDQVQLTHAPCPCGRNGGRIQWLAQRCDDLLNIRGVKVHSRQIERHLQDVLGFLPHFRYFDHAQFGIRRFLEVQLTLDDRIFSDEIRQLEMLVDHAEEQLMENLGIPVQVKLKEKPDAAISSGSC